MTSSLISVSNSQRAKSKPEKSVVQVNLRLQRIWVTERKRVSSFVIILELKGSMHRRSEYVKII